MTEGPQNLPEEALVALAARRIEAGPAREVMALSLLDWAACGLAGVREPVAGIVRGRAVGAGAVLFGGGEAEPARAALINGTISHALDYDDTHFDHIGHTSVGVIPAALALAADMDGLVDASLVGSEAAIRVGVWLGRGHYQAGFHQTATAGAFGATVAAGRLLGLKAEGLRMALGLAATRASGLKSQFGTMAKPYNAGLAAETGVEAALLARAGMTASGAGLSDPQGFGPTHHGAGDGAAFEGEDWRFVRVSHKFHACCHGLHAMLEALAEARTPVAEIAAVTVRTHPRWLTVCNIAAPRTGLEAKFSYRLAAAMALSGVSTAAIDSFSDATAGDPRLIALRDRVTVVSDESLSEMEAVVELRGNGIERLHHDLSRPLDLETRRARIEAKAEALIGDRAGALAAAIASGDLPAFLRNIGTPLPPR